MKQTKILTILIITITVIFSSCNGNPYASTGGATKELAYYLVKDGKIIPSKFGNETYPAISSQDRVEHEQIWKKAMLVIPNDYEKYFNAFRISSDGVDNIMAFVEPGDKQGLADLSTWTLGVDPVDYRIATDMNESLIHEFAHVLSINSNQCDPVKDTGDEKSWIDTWNFVTENYRMYDSVTKKDSYLNNFFQEFWTVIKLKESFAIDKLKTNQEKYNAAMADKYKKNGDDYVTEYAMTNPGEDFAESFVFFVTRDKPVGSDLKDKKIQSFYLVPELVRIRNEIRTALFNL